MINNNHQNIYFYISITSIGFSYILIYYFYEMKFSLTRFLDIKTILTVLGTILGAYLGARQAGKYSVRVMLEQQNLRDIESNRRNHEQQKRLYIYLLSNVTHVRSLLTKPLEDNSFLSNNASYLNSIENIIMDVEKVEYTFEKLDYSSLDIELIPKVQTLQIYLRASIRVLKNFFSAIESCSNLNENALNEHQKSTIHDSLTTIRSSLKDMDRALEETVSQIESHLTNKG